MARNDSTAKLFSDPADLDSKAAYNNVATVTENNDQKEMVEDHSAAEDNTKFCARIRSQKQHPAECWRMAKNYVVEFATAAAFVSTAAVARSQLESMAFVELEQQPLRANAEFDPV